VPDSPRLLPLIKVCLLAMPPYVAGPHSCADKFVPRHLSDGFGQLPFGHGDPLANQRAMAPIDKPHCSACGDEMELSLLIPPVGGPYGLKVFTCPRCGRSKDYLIGRPEAA